MQESGKCPNKPLGYETGNSALVCCVRNSWAMSIFLYPPGCATGVVSFIRYYSREWNRQSKFLYPSARPKRYAILPSMTIAQRKQQLRLDMKLLSSTIALEERERNSNEIVRKLSTVGAYVRSDLVLGFVPLPSEPDLAPLYDAALADGKVVALPRCIDDGRMVFHAVGPNWRQQLLKGPWGIPEPILSLDMLGELEQAGAVVVVVPALAFTPHRRRLGRGKGYYDRFLGASNMPNLTSIGVCFDYQIQMELPVDEYDASVDLVVTESAVY